MIGPFVSHTMSKQPKLSPADHMKLVNGIKEILSMIQKTSSVMEKSALFEALLPATVAYLQLSDRKNSIVNRLMPAVAEKIALFETWFKNPKTVGLLRHIESDPHMHTLLHQARLGRQRAFSAL